MKLRGSPSRAGRALRKVAFLAVGLALLAAEAPLRAETETIDLGGVRPETSALLLSGGEGGDLRLALVALPMGLPQDGKSEVLLVAEIDGNMLVAGADDGPLGLEISTYALGPGDTIADFMAEGLRLELPRDRNALAAGGLRYLTNVQVPAGKSSIRVLVRQRRTGAFGVRRIDLEISSPARVPLAPQLPALEQTWLDARSPRLAAIPSLLPAALPVLGAGPVRVRVPLPPVVTLSNISWRLAEEGGSSTRELPATVVERQPGGRGNLDVAVLEWTPPMLPQGTYMLSFVSRASDGRATESPAARVLSPGDEGAKLWTELDVGRAAKFAALPQQTPGGARGGLQEMEEYRRALARLAAGDRFGALSAVAAFELRVLTTRKQFAALRDIEQKMLLELAKRDGEALLPVALLHQDLCRRYLSEGKPGFPRHALDTALWIAEQYGKRGPEAAPRAAQVVISLAGSAIDAGAPKRAAELFERAAALDPANELARLGRAAVLTRLGDLPGARAELGRLLDHYPEHREGRLRSALLAARSADTGGAERELRELLAGNPTPDWVTALAYQELGRLLLLARRADAAKELLAQAARRLPDDPGIMIALAYACERSGDRACAQAEIGRRAAVVSGGESARRRFSRWPDEALRAARRSFQEDALLRLPLLAAALGKPAAATG